MFCSDEHWGFSQPNPKNRKTELNVYFINGKIMAYRYSEFTLGHLIIIIFKVATIGIRPLYAIYCN